MSDPIRIGLDAHMVGAHETGNETYVLGLIGGLAGTAGEFKMTVYHAGVMPATPGAILRRLASANSWIRLGLELPVRSWRDDLDVLHTSYVAPIWSKAPTVVTVHDISFASHPEWFSSRDLRVLGSLVPWSMRRAARVITVSDLCRQEIIERYRLPPEKVVRIYNAAGPAAQSVGHEEAGRFVAELGVDLSRPIILTVGNLQPRKNLVRLIDAYSQVVASGHDAQLVVVGPEHYRAELIHQAAAAASAGSIYFTGYLSDRGLAACYSVATAFVFPSLYEGFGIPAVEAMAHGAPVACSRAGALPEVCGEAALYFDPLDIGSIAGAVTQLLSSVELRRQLSAAGRARREEFSWAQTAAQTLDVYCEAAGRSVIRQTTR